MLYRLHIGCTFQKQSKSQKGGREITMRNKKISTTKNTIAAIFFIALFIMSLVGEGLYMSQFPEPTWSEFIVFVMVPSLLFYLFCANFHAAAVRTKILYCFVPVKKFKKIQEAQKKKQESKW